MLNRNKRNIVKKILMIILMAIPAFSYGKNVAGNDTISARRAFLELPALSLQLLPKETREDMLIYFDNDSIWSARNALEGRSMLETVSPDYLKVRMTPVSTLQIKIFPGKKGDVVMTVYTVGNAGEGTADSEVRFYDAQMRELDASGIFKAPELKDFFLLPKGSRLTIRDIEAQLPFYTVQLSAAGGSDSVELIFNPEDYISIEGMDMIKPYLKSPIKYSWDGKKLKKQ